MVLPPNNFYSHELTSRVGCSTTSNILDNIQDSKNCFSLEAANISHLNGRTPPLQKWLVDGLIPQGVVGGIVAAGGVGKSMLTLQLGAAVSCGYQFFDRDVPNPGSVLYVSAEDDRNEIHRRLNRITLPMTPSARERVFNSLKVVSTAGKDMPFFLKHRAGKGTITPHFERCLDLCLRINDLRLVVIDTYSRYNQTDEMDQAMATFVVAMLEVIKETTGATVLLVHHTRKANSGTQFDVRGASALVNSLRWMAMLVEGKVEDDGRQNLAFRVSKFNYGSTLSIPLMKNTDGLLHPVDVDVRSRTEIIYDDIIQGIREIIKDANQSGSSVFESHIRAQSGKGKRIQYSDKTVRKYIADAIKRGDLTKNIHGHIEFTSPESIVFHATTHPDNYEEI